MMIGGEMSKLYSMWLSITNSMVDQTSTVKGKHFEEEEVEDSQVIIIVEGEQPSGEITRFHSIWISITDETVRQYDAIIAKEKHFIVIDYHDKRLIIELEELVKLIEERGVARPDSSPTL